MVRQVGGPIFLPSEKKEAKKIAQRTGTEAVPVRSFIRGPSSGGGGGSSGQLPSGPIVPQASIEQALAEKKAEEQAKIEEQIAQQEAANLLQEQAFKGTIAGQLSADQDQFGKVSQVQPLPEGDLPSLERIGLFEAFKRSGKAFFGRLTGRGELDDIVAPFDLTTVPKAEQKTFVDPRTGKRIDTSRLTGKQIELLGEFTGGQEITFETVQRGIEEKREERIGTQFATLQEDVNLGKISVEEAQEQFQTNVEEIFATTPDVPGISAPRRSGVRTLVDIAVSSNPLTAFAATAVSAEQDPGVLLESGEIIFPPSPRTQSFALAGLVGAGGKLSKAGRELTQAQIEGVLERAGTSRRGFRFVKGKDILDVDIGLATTGDFGAITKTQTFSRITDKGIVRSAGTTEELVLGTTAFRQDPFIVGSRQIFKGTQKLIPLGDDAARAAASLGKIESQQTAAISGVLREGKVFGGVKAGVGKVRTDFIGGIGKTVDDFALGTGGRITGAEVFSVKGTGFEVIKGAKFKFPQESSSILKILRTKIDDVGGFKVITPRGGTKTPLSTTFTQTTIPKINIGTSNLDKIVSTPTTLETVTEASVVNLPRSVGAGETGLTEVQLQRFAGRGFETIAVSPKGVLVPKEFETIGFRPTPGLTPPKVTFGVRPTIREEAFAITRTGLLPITKEITVTGLVQPQRSLQGLGLGQPQKSLQPQQLKQLQTPAFASSFTGPGPSFRGDFGFPRGGFIFPPLPSLGGVGTRGKAKRRAKARVPIRPSLTGIILGIEAPAIVSPTFGVSPFSIRGLRTGFNVPKRRSTTKKKTIKKRPTRKRSRGNNFGGLKLTNI